MYVRTKSTPNSPKKAVQIIESRRVDGKPRQKIVRHLGTAATDEQIAELTRLGEAIIREMENPGQLNLEGKSYTEHPHLSDVEAPVPEGTQVDVSKLRDREHIVEGPKEILGAMYRFLGLDFIFGNSDKGRGKTNMLEGCAIGRVVAPASKSATARFLKEKMHISASEDRIYRMMDNLADKEKLVKEIIADKTRRMSGGRIALMLYDVTTLYFESFREDDLRQTGFSKDNKVKETQVVLALATDGEGLPLWYELFPGKTAESKTLLAALDSFAALFKPDQTILVADRGLSNRINIAEIASRGFYYIFGAKLKGMKRSVREEILDRSDYIPGIDPADPEGTRNNGEHRDRRGGNEGNTTSAEVEDLSERDSSAAGESDGGASKGSETEDAPAPTFMIKTMERQQEGDTLVLSWSAARARKDCREREKQVERAEAQLGGKESIPSDRLVKNSATRRYMKARDRKSRGEYVLDTDKIEQERRWDGIHGLVTNLPGINADTAHRVLGRYHELWHIEESFRVQKHSLQIRPIYHWTEKRIRSHVSICYIAFAMYRFLQHQVRIQQNENLSVEQIRKTLLDVQSAVIEDTATGKKYRFPGTLSPEAKRIYKALGARRNEVPTELLSLRKYRNRRSYETT